ncbi:MAG TPA: DUF5658 family protein [Dehalococcoidales bacterium]|nr:DUF5658 family protein [Dehalococcoidales bacterium]
MLAKLMASAVTFKKGTFEKLTFVFLNLLDMVLTVFALSQGAYELNPLMRAVVNSPFQLYITKIAIPLLLAWLLPGKLLWPSIVLLTFVAGWNIRELLIFYF